MSCQNSKQIIFYFPSFFCRCRASSDCPGFLINYERESCFRVDFNTDDRRDDLIPATSRVNYFEKVCLEGKSQKKSVRLTGFPYLSVYIRNSTNIS